MEHWRLVENPTGEIYQQFIKVLCSNSDKFYFVTRKEDDYNQEVLIKFDPYIIKKYKSNKWAGTVTRGSSATIHEIEVSKATRILLLQSAQSLYDWVAPLPEDLSFIQKGFIWFFSTTHEEFGEFRVCETYQREWIDQIQGIKLEKAEYYPRY